MTHDQFLVRLHKMLKKGTPWHLPDRKGVEGFVDSYLKTLSEGTDLHRKWTIAYVLMEQSWREWSTDATQGLIRVLLPGHVESAVSRKKGGYLVRIIHWPNGLGFGGDGGFHGEGWHEFHEARAGLLALIDLCATKELKRALAAE